MAEYKAFCRWETKGDPKGRFILNLNFVNNTSTMTPMDEVYDSHSGWIYCNGADSYEAAKDASRKIREKDGLNITCSRILLVENCLIGAYS